ncbi:MAG TPA: prepilin peptidase [Micromonosporaceae bacterium]|jgi:leader peptidase (prepilin peptidase)/N-methyltransferase|nr:prepilin peptidase [Micromonosporaceae bacterium]
MSALLVPTCAALGAIAGALVPRVAYRLSVDHSATPRSACAICSWPFPPGLAGWVRISARCPGCRTRLGPPGWLTALIGAAACAVLGWSLDGKPALVLVAFLAVAVLGVLLAAIDLACLRLPDLLVAGTGGVALALLGTAAIVSGDAGPLLRGLLAAAVLGGGYLLLALLPGANLGFGDVKLAAVLGLLLGWVGWLAVLLGAVLPHLINGPVALGLLLTNRAGRKTELPLGPALLAGALAAIAIAS